MTRILYVDDQDDIREIAEMALGLDPDLQVKTCASGREGLEAARAWQPDLIMLDVMMPGMDGPETFARLKDDPAWDDTPVVFITARTQTHQVAELIKLGARGVISKPFDPMKLAAEVRRYLKSAGANG